MKTFSIAIPVYEMGGMGAEVLEFGFSKIKEQALKDYEVIVSDHSLDNKIYDLCKKWDIYFDIKYFRNPEDLGSPSSNTNNAIKNCSGKLIRILCQDDYFFDKYSLSIIYDNFTDDINWLFSSYLHTEDHVNYYKYFVPSVHPNMYVVNLLGTPSAMTFRNHIKLPEFDKNLFYSYDCDFYYQMYKLYGIPKIISQITMANFIWKNSITSSISQEIINKENIYVLRKHGFIS